MADKTLTIKGASDKELDDLIRRLRKESELQNIIQNLKRLGDLQYPTSYDDDQSVSTEEAIEKLYHFGIPGMRWGRKRGTSKGPPSEEHMHKEVMTKKHIRELSNSDIKKLNERLQLEKQYRELTKKQMSPGKKFIADLLISQGKKLATDYITKNGFAGMKDSIGKMKPGATPIPKVTPKPMRKIGFGN